jgi:hypothetical protein
VSAAADAERSTKRAARGVGMAVMLSVVLAGGQFWLTGDAGVDVYDEGFFWYGVTQTVAGEVPVRDFQSYDPGRYYWSAAWSLVLGDGLLALRGSLALFQALGLFCGLLTARRITPNPWLLALVGSVLLVWMFPRHKLFEPSLAMMAVFFATRLVEEPNARRHLVSGLFVGAAAFIGRNHGVYAAFGNLMVICLLQLKHRQERPFRNLAAWSGGVLLGFSPMLLLMILAVSSISAAYVLLALAYPLGILAILRTRSEDLRARSVLIACVCVGVFYSHHAWVRAGTSHLAQAIHPLWLGLLAAPAAFGWRSRRLPTLAAWGAVVSMTVLFVVGGSHRILGLDRHLLVPYDADGDIILVPPQRARELRGMKAAVQSRVGPEEPLFIAPYRPLYYRLLRRESPVWGLYFLRAGQGQDDAEMIRTLEDEEVDWVFYVHEVLVDVPHFRLVRPEVLAYLEREFAAVPTPGLPPGHFLLYRVGAPLPSSDPPVPPEE